MRIALLLLIAGIVATGCLKLDSLAFPADNTIEEYLFDDYEGRTDMEVPAEYSIAPEFITIIQLESKDESGAAVNIQALYIGDLSTLSTDTVIVYCHGQADHMDFYWNRAKLLANCGGKNRFGVFMMDYQGYGLSEGSASEQGMFNDLETCMNWLVEQGVEQEQTILYGFSLGTSPATYTAAYGTHKSSRLILESPFASANNIAQESTLINFPASFIMDLEFNNADIIKDVKMPFCWLHGTKDDYIAITNGELVYQNHNGFEKYAIRVEGAKHGEDGVPQTLGYSTYLQHIEDFITGQGI